MNDNNTAQKSEGGHGSTVAPVSQPPTKGWVQFDEETAKTTSDSPAVITTENVQVNLERSLNKSGENSNIAVLDPKPLRNVELPIATVEPIRQGFCKFIKNLLDYICNITLL